MKTYKIKKGWAYFVYITCPFLIFIFGYLAFIYTIKIIDSKNYNWFWLLIPSVLVVFPFMIAGLIDVYKSKFIIEDDKVTLINTFCKKEFKVEEIEGYRLHQNQILIKSFDKRIIKLNNYIENFNEIESWLFKNYKDLDIQQSEEELNVFLDEVKFGETLEQREKYLKQAKKVAFFLNGSAIFLVAYLLIFKMLFKVEVIAAVGFPLICVLILMLYKGTIRFKQKNYSAFPSMAVAFMVSCTSILLISIIRYKILNYGNLFLLSSAFAFITQIIMSFANVEFSFKKNIQYFSILGFTTLMFVYSFGSITILNCSLDKTKNTIYKAKIEAKKTTGSDNDNYFFTLSAWGNIKETKNHSVTKDLFDKLNENDSINIIYHLGKFNIHWIELFSSK